MNKVLLLSGILCLLAISANAQSNAESGGDTVLAVKMPEVKVTADRDWGNDTIRYQYNQMKYYVTTILPYLNAATKLFSELNEKINDPNLGKHERKEFVRTKEDELHTRFEDEITKLNETQGILLLKLIGRQTGVNIYEMLNEFKNPFTAIKWQAWAKFHGFNLNKKYVPDDEPMLENIMLGLNYPLPEIYGNHAPIGMKKEQVKYQTRKW
jgi:hypothetical protein